MAFLILGNPVAGQAEWRFTSFPLAEESRIEQTLQEKKLVHLDRSNALVEVSDFKGIEWVRAQDLNQKLDNQDPRWDPYLRQIASLFSPLSSDGSSPLWYQGEEPWRDQKTFKSQPRAGGAWGGLFSVFCFLSFQLWLFLKRESTKKILILGALGTGLLFSGFPFLMWIILYLMSHAWTVNLDLRARHQGAGGEAPSLDKKIGVWWGGGILFFALVCMTGGLEWWRFGLWVGTGAGLAAVLWVYFQGKALGYSKMEHRLFVPIKLGAREKKKVLSWSKGRLAAILGVWVFGLGGLIPLGIGSATSSSVPLALPSWQEYLKHRWYQESLPYGFNYKLSLPGSQVQLPSYQWTGGRVQETPKVVQNWDSDWEKNVSLGQPESAFARVLRGPAP